MDGQKQIPDADGDFSHAPIFKFNDGKVKFDTNRVDNANDNYGSASGFLPKSFLNTEMPSKCNIRGHLLYLSLTDLIQPPSILPISSIAVCKDKYFLLSIACMSFIRRIKILNKFNLWLVFSRTSSFSDLYFWLANSSSSIISKVVGLINIEKANTISALWKFAGYHVKNGKAPKRIKGGGKLEYNSQLRSMCWRLSGAMIKSGIRQFCVKCDTQRPAKKESEELVCESCGGKTFQSRQVSKFAEYYLKEKNKYFEKLTAQGIKIVPASQLPKNNGKKYEPEKVISEGHIHNMALRKMIKLFLACLWLEWRKAEGLSTRAPYSHEYQGHTTIISPEEMTDR